MNLTEQFIDGDGDKFHIKRTFDASPVLTSTAALRSAGATGMSENKHIGRIPGWMITEWLKEAGVKWSDADARNEIIRKKLLSGEVAKLRVWEGTF